MIKNIAIIVLIFVLLVLNVKNLAMTCIIMGLDNELYHMLIYMRELSIFCLVVLDRLSLGLRFFGLFAFIDHDELVNPQITHSRPLQNFKVKLSLSSR